MMDNLNSEWAVESTDLNEFKSNYVEIDEDDKYFEADENSLELSGDSGDDDNSKNYLESSLNKVRNVALAKKRLQAYTNKTLLQKNSLKNKNEESDKGDKSLLRKSKKDYPDDRAKAVIQEIEELKKREAKVAQEIHEEQLKNDLITKEAIAAAIKNIKNLASNMGKPRSRSLSSERDRQFKKREIKRRNYRRTESYDRRSNSPSDRNRKSSRSSKRSYPKNWVQYNQENFTSTKDEELKSKLFKQKTTSNVEMYHKLYSCDAPSHFIAPFKYSSETETKEVPFSYFRVTRSHPKISFCVNYQKNKESFLTRTQLFHIIPNTRKQHIEKLINSFGKSHSSAKPLETRAWYGKLWRKKDAECKVLENSVGLSFLQTYSDEEEEIDNEEIVICSSTKSNPKIEPIVSISDIKQMQDKIHSDIETKQESQINALYEAKAKGVQEPDSLHKLETPTDETFASKTKEDNAAEYEPGEIIDEIENLQADEKEYTPEKELLIHKMAREAETIQTDKIVRILGKELSKNSDNSLEETGNKKTKSKHSNDDDDTKEKRREDKKKKNSKKTEEVFESNSEDEKYSKRKKKKNKMKSKKQGTTDDEDSSDDEKKATKNKKKDQKKDKLKKKLNKKQTLGKETKSKMKDDVLHEDIKRDKKNSKKKPVLEDELTEEKEVDRKKKKPKKKRDESESSSSDDDSSDEKQTKLAKSKTKKLNKKKAEVDVDYFDEDIGKMSETEKKHDKSFSHKINETSLDEEKIIIETNSGRNMEYTDLRQKLVAKSSQLRQKPKEKGVDFEDKRKSEKIRSPENRNDLRWELLENKRKRRHDEDFEDFPLEKDIFTDSLTKIKDSNTPDTDEYLPNWEKEPDAVWESEEELPPKPKGKLNSSWESDEETFERSRGLAEIRTFKDSLDLEIPLNIKPFKRRPEFVADMDNDFAILKPEGKNHGVERRRLEIEKFKVKQLELKVINEIENKELFEGRFESTPPSFDRIKEMSLNTETRRGVERVLETADHKREVPSKSVLFDLDKIQEKAKLEMSKPRRDRWDQKIAASSTPIKNIVDLTFTTPEEKVDRDELLIISSSTEINETSAVLENEYEQFIKAVSTNAAEKKEKIIIDIASKAVTPSAISPRDVSFIPMPNEIKPVPVPSPKLEVDKIPNPLINLSLSANITLDISSKIESPGGKDLSMSSPVPTSHLAPVSKLEAIVSSSTIDLKPRVIKTEKTENKLSSIESISKLVPNVDLQVGSPFEDMVVASNANKDKLDVTKPLTFAGMTIPTKKTLLDNSNLKLGDSDEEEAFSKPIKIRQLDDIKKENLIQEDTVVAKCEQASEIKTHESFDTEVPAYPVHKRTKSRSPQPPKRSDIKQSRRESSPKKSARYSSPVRSRRNDSPSRKRSSPSRRHTPPRRSPRRRSPLRSQERKSPIRNRRSPSRRSPGRRSPTGKRRYSSRRSKSPSYRRRRGSISPRRRSPRRSSSPRHSSAKRPRSRSPEKSHGLWKSPEREKRSRGSAASPLERLKRSVADSTISDDLLPQPSHNSDEYTNSPVTGFYDAAMKMPDAPIRTPLGIDFTKQPPKNVNVSYGSYNYEQNNFAHMNQYMNPMKTEMSMLSKTATSQQGFVQVGNMVQIVPRDLDLKTEIGENNGSQRAKTENLTVIHKEKSQIVQVGNIVQIVPTDFSPEIIKLPEPPLPPEPPPPQEAKEDAFTMEASPTLSSIQEKQSAEETMKIKTAERIAERERRRQEKERKRQEKEKRRKERETKRQLRMKQKTENMIKRALQLEVAAMAEEEAPLDESMPPWLSVPMVTGVSKDVGKSILIKGGFSSNSSKADKNVKFADGVRPGEGTSPSGGEELSSPPPKKILPKEKRYTKTKLKNKSPKKKVKVKVIKKTSVPPTDDEQEDDNLPPPSPPPGSPPPHIFPPRVKTTMINNIHPSFVLAVQTTGSSATQPAVTVPTSHSTSQFAQQQLQLQEQELHQQHPSTGLLMAPPPFHHDHRPFGPPPHHHHGPPHHGPPHHGPPMPPHHGPPMPPHHGPPMPPHHGPSMPPHHGPPGHHHGPPLPGPPGPPHHRPPYHF